MENIRLVDAAPSPPLVAQLRRPSNPVYRKRLNRGLRKSVYSLLEPLAEGLYATTIYERLSERGLVDSDAAKGMRAIRQALNYLQSIGYVKHLPPRWVIKDQTTVESVGDLLAHAQQMKFSTICICEKADGTGEIFYDGDRCVEPITDLEQNQLHSLLEALSLQTRKEEDYRENVYDGYIQIHNYSAAIHATGVAAPPATRLKMLNHLIQLTLYHKVN